MQFVYISEGIYFLSETKNCMQPKLIKSDCYNCHSPRRGKNCKLALPNRRISEDVEPFYGALYSGWFTKFLVHDFGDRKATSVGACQNARCHRILIKLNKKRKTRVGLHPKSGRLLETQIGVWFCAKCEFGHRPIFPSWT